MAAAMNGIALSGGLIPYGGTFLVFTDYCRASIRLSALMRQRVIYVMTHDSIGLGEDGPTHQPVEHLAALRAIPHLLVMRPAEGRETTECWEIALRTTRTRRCWRCRGRRSRTCARRRRPRTCRRQGRLRPERAGRRPRRHADRTGSELALAAEAAKTLASEGIKAAVVSMPSMELFRAQAANYRAQVLGTAPRVAVEAGVGAVLVRMARRQRPLHRLVGLRCLGAGAASSIRNSASPPPPSRRPRAASLGSEPPSMRRDQPQVDRRCGCRGQARARACRPQCAGGRRQGDATRRVLSASSPASRT